MKNLICTLLSICLLIFSNRICFGALIQDALRPASFSCANAFKNTELSRNRIQVLRNHIPGLRQEQVEITAKTMRNDYRFFIDLAHSAMPGSKKENKHTFNNAMIQLKEQGFNVCFINGPFAQQLSPPAFNGNVISANHNHCLPSARETKEFLQADDFINSPISFMMENITQHVFRRYAVIMTKKTTDFFGNAMTVIVCFDSGNGFKTKDLTRAVKTGQVLELGTGFGAKSKNGKGLNFMLRYAHFFRIMQGTECSVYSNVFNSFTWSEKNDKVFYTDALVETQGLLIEAWYYQDPPPSKQRHALKKAVRAAYFPFLIGKQDPFSSDAISLYKVIEKSA